jgi:hypothetical protein
MPTLFDLMQFNLIILLFSSFKNFDFEQSLI